MRDIWDTPLGKARLKEIEDEQKSAKKSTRVSKHGGFLQRMYSAARSSRLTADWNAANSSADNELVSSLQVVRSRSRALIRDASYAKRARVLVVNNVVGTGIGMQAQVMTSRDQLNDRINDAIEETWEEWSEAASCHTGGRLSFSNFERALIGQVFDAGEVFVRKHHITPGRSSIPFSLELIEAERLADQLDTTSYTVAPGNQLRMGVEMDRFFRPVAYYIRARHPSEVRFTGQPDEVERVPADQVIHLAVIDRWPQTRGEPWLHAAMRRMNDMDGYSEAEIIRARVQAATPWTIETPEDGSSLGEEQADGSYEMESEPGVAKRLNPGEKMNAPSPNAPNPALDPFMRCMLREVAAGAGVSYASLSMDYSQSNYSSSRLALLDDRDLWRFYQAWFICDFRKQIHREWLAAAVVSRSIPEIQIAEYAINQKKFEKVLFKPRGWSWIDPSSEVDAYEKAVINGFTAVTDVIQQTAGGMDIEDVLKVRERELKMMRDKGLVFMTSPEVYTAAAKKDTADAKSAAKPPDPPPDAASDSTDNAPPRAGRVVFGVVKNDRNG